MEIPVKALVPKDGLPLPNIIPIPDVRTGVGQRKPLAPKGQTIVARLIVVLSLALLALTTIAPPAQAGMIFGAMSNCYPSAFSPFGAGVSSSSCGTHVQVSASGVVPEVNQIAESGYVTG